MHALAVFVGVAAGPAAVPHEYVIDVVVHDGDPAVGPEAVRPNVVTRRTVAVRDGYVGIVTTQAVRQLPESGPLLNATEGLVLRHAALVVVTPRRTPAGLVLEVEGVAHGPGWTPAGMTQEVLPAVPGKPVRFTLSERSPSDRTWVELTVRPDR